MTARDVVRAYVDARTASGRHTARNHCAILGKYAREILDAGRWDDETLMLAVQAFAHTNRHPRFLEEWLLETWTRQEIQAHEVQKHREQTVRMDKPLAKLDLSRYLSASLFVEEKENR